MSRTISIKIQGSGADTDAPTADDFLDQVRDYLDILRGVEAAIAEDGHGAIEWRVVDATKNSPITCTLEAFPRKYGTDITRRADDVAQQAAEGLNALKERPCRPPFFPDDVLKKVEKTFQRVANGLNLSEVDFGNGTPPFVVTPAIARSAAKNVGLALKPTEKPYNELGSVEGITRGVDVDGHGRRLLYVRHRLTGNVIKCILQGQSLEEIGQFTIAELLRGIRVRVCGTIRFRSLGHITQVEATEIVFARPRTDLPSIDDIIDENFTGGLRSEEYLGKLRDGRLS